MNDIKKKIQDIWVIIEDLKNMPQTYDTILKECREDGTCQIILRRKLNKLFRMGMVYKSQIPGTRFGKAIFYAHDKKYQILVESTRTGSEVYCFSEFKKLMPQYIMVPKTQHLEGCEWRDVGQKIFFEGNVLKFF